MFQVIKKIGYYNIILIIIAISALVLSIISVFNCNKEKMKNDLDAGDSTDVMDYSIPVMFNKKHNSNINKALSYPILSNKIPLDRPFIISGQPKEDMSSIYTCKKSNNKKVISSLKTICNNTGCKFISKPIYTCTGDTIDTCNFISKKY